MQETRRFLPETPGDADMAQMAHMALMIEAPTSQPARPSVPLWVDHLVQACENCRAGFYFEEGGCFGFAVALREELCKIQPSAQIGMSKEFSHCVVLLGAVALDHQGDLPLEKTQQYPPLIGEDAVYAAAAQAGHTRDDVDGDAAWAREVIAQAKFVCMNAHRDARFSLMLSNCDEIAAHIDATTPDGIDAEFAQEAFFGTQAVLVRVPTQFVKANGAHTDNHIAIAERDAHYKTLPEKTAPPIILGEGGLIADGHHRHRAAVARNDSRMLAYQVIDADIDLGLALQAIGPVKNDPHKDPDPDPGLDAMRNRDPVHCTAEQIALAIDHTCVWVHAHEGFEQAEHTSHLAMSGQCDVFAKVLSDHLERLGIPHAFAVMIRYTSFTDGRADDVNHCSHVVLVLHHEDGQQTHLDAQGVKAIENFQEGWFDAADQRTDFEVMHHSNRHCLDAYLNKPIENYGKPKSHGDDHGAAWSWASFFKAIRAKESLATKGALAQMKP